MEFQVSDIVISLTGSDKGKFFFVTEKGCGCVLLADGKRRKLSSPKRKNTKHISLAGRIESPLVSRMENGGSISDKEIRRALAEFRAGACGNLGGVQNWQKTM